VLARSLKSIGRRSQASSADAQHARVLEPLLPGHGGDVTQIDRHRERNRVLVKVLSEKGVQVTDSVDAEMHFWAPDRRAAAFLAKELYDLGYLVLVIKPAARGGKEWNVEAGQHCQVIDAVSDGRTATLVRLATRFGATYDGWGTSVRRTANVTDPN
jgi:regulator of RNase E activity RraB